MRVSKSPGVTRIGEVSLACVNFRSPVENSSKEIPPMRREKKEKGQGVCTYSNACMHTYMSITAVVAVEHGVHGIDVGRKIG